MKTLSIALVEDDPVVKKSLEMFIRANPQFDLQTSCTSVEDFIGIIGKIDGPKPHILLLDIQLPGMSGIEGIPHIREHLPDTDIIMLTTFEESEKIFAALCAGACSYLTKRTSLLKIQEAIVTVGNGGSYMSPSIARKVVGHFKPKPKEQSVKLTQRQTDIVEGIVDGLSYKMVADKLNISIDTVRTHIKHVYKALNINSKGELIKRAMEGKV